jgi:glutathione S-transferase
MDEWAKIKSKTPMGQLPLLEFDGNVLCQSTAIGRYLARECGLAGKNSYEMALADMYVDGIQDMWANLHTVYMPLMTGDQQTFKSEWAKFKVDHLPTFLQRYDGFLCANKSGWLVGNNITWADLTVSEFLANLQDSFAADALEGHPNLKKYVEKVQSLPQVKEYIKNRPKTAF